MCVSAMSVCVCTPQTAIAQIPPMQATETTHRRSTFLLPFHFISFRFLWLFCYLQASSSSSKYTLYMPLNWCWVPRSFIVYISPTLPGHDCTTHCCWWHDHTPKKRYHHHSHWNHHHHLHHHHHHPQIILQQAEGWC
jgi:hypothetical protein